MFMKREPIEIAEAGMEDALRNFRSSIHAWSEAEFVRPRAVLHPEHRRAWRRATAWALGCVLAAGTLSAGLYDHHSHDRLARTVAQQMIAQRMAAQRAAGQRASLPRSSFMVGRPNKSTAGIFNSTTDSISLINWSTELVNSRHGCDGIFHSLAGKGKKGIDQLIYCEPRFTNHATQVFRTPETPWPIHRKMHNYFLYCTIYLAISSSVR